MANCLVCSRAAHSDTAQHFFGEYTSCDHCGKFIVETSLVVDPQIKSCMLHYLWFQHNKTQMIVFHNDKINNDIDSKIKYVSRDALLNLFPMTFTDRIDKSLLNLSRYCEGVGSKFGYASDIPDSINNNAALIKTMFFVIDNDPAKADLELYAFLRMLIELGYIAETSAAGSSCHEYRITANGWMHIQELEQKKRTSKQVFIAMSFDPKMNSVRDKIKDAITVCGFLPNAIIEKEHCNQIVPEILNDIKNSYFIVADFTENRPGVYYEAGYAEGLGIPVIATCKDADFNDRHFDIAQKNTIKWQAESDLYAKLVKRIEAVTGLMQD